ncbi:MAG: HlyD family efflux transporter periplasmic adaptor subunit [Betaproteobacteria bacterium]
METIVASSRRRALPLLAAAALIIGCGPAGERPLPGYVEGEYVRVAAPFAGTLTQLSVRRGANVAAGAPMFALERENETAARREAEARLTAAESRLANLKSGKRAPEVETVVEQLQQAKAARDLSSANLKRQQQLFASGFISGAAIDDARTQLKRDEARVAELNAAVATTRMPARTDEIGAAEADARAAREVVAQSDWRLAQRAVAAPVAGLVHDTYYTAGDWVPAGSPVVSLLPPANVKVRFYVPEPQLARVKAGNEIAFGCDGCGAPVNATIDYVSNRAEFTPPVLYSKENRAKLVFLVEARPAPAAAAGLKPGQPVDVTLR